MVQSVKCLTSAQVSMSRFEGLIPVVRPYADSSEPGACFRFCVSLSLYFYPLMFCLSLPIKNKHFRGAWVAQSVKQPTSAQVMISRSMALSPTSGSVLTAQSLGPASDSVVFPSLCPSRACALILSLSLKINKN